MKVNLTNSDKYCPSCDCPDCGRKMVPRPDPQPWTPYPWPQTPYPYQPSTPVSPYCGGFVSDQGTASAWNGPE